MEPDLNLIAKGRLSLAEALQQLETVNNAFVKAERIEKRQLYLDASVQDIQKNLENFASTSFLTNKLEEFSSYIKKTISQKFEEFSSNYLYQLNEKANNSDVESLLSQRVTWVAFNNYAQQYASMKARLEKHILSDFEGFKAKVKLELSHKAEEKKSEDDVTSDEIQQLRNRITSLEQKYHEMFMEEGLDDSEDYDSQEEMDNFIEDIDKKDKNSEDDIEGDSPDDENQEFGKRNMISEASPEVIRGPLSIPLSKISSVTPPEVSPRAEPMDTEKTEVSEDPPKTEQKVEQVEKVEKIERKPTMQEVESRAKSRSSIEIDNGEAALPKMQRNRGSSRADGQTLSRKNSMASSMGGGMAGGGMNGGIRQLNKKVMGMQKDMDGYKVNFDQIDQNLLEQKEEFAKVYEKIKETVNRIEEVEQKRQGMEMSFIKALRRNGVDKKQKKNQVMAAIDAGQLSKVYEAIHNKNKKIKTMTTFVEKAAADIMVMKDKQNQKINEIVKSIKFFEDVRSQTNQQFKSVNEDIRKVEKNLKNSVQDLNSQIKNLQGPLTDLISDQQRENEMLSYNIKAQQQLLQELLSKSSQEKLTEEPSKHMQSSQSPSLSVKHKLSSGFRRTSVPTCKNWLEDVPDGVALSLPRVNIPSSHIKKLSY